jgi:hypothetical protein
VAYFNFRCHRIEHTGTGAKKGPDMFLGRMLLVYHWGKKQDLVDSRKKPRSSAQ